MRVNDNRLEWINRLVIEWLQQKEGDPLEEFESFIDLLVVVEPAIRVYVVGVLVWMFWGKRGKKWVGKRGVGDRKGWIGHLK